MRALAAKLAARFFDAIDLVFDAIAAIWRVIARGAFQADSRSFRGARFLALPPSDVLVQTIELNAADIGQARKIVALDPARHLPLAPDAATYDLAGPVDEEGALRSRPERAYLIGLVRREALAAKRREAKKSWLAGIEAFIAQPPEHSARVFVFRDAEGHRLRRRRRALTALALIALLWSASDAANAWREKLDETALQAEQARLSAERRIRLAERRVQTTRRTLAEFEAQQSAPIGDIADRLWLFAQRQPAHAELTKIEWRANRLRIEGKSYRAIEVELELRRAFEGAAVDFATTQQGAPETFQASVSWRAGAAPAAQAGAAAQASAPGRAPP